MEQRETLTDTVEYLHRDPPAARKVVAGLLVILMGGAMWFAIEAWGMIGAQDVRIRTLEVEGAGVKVEMRETNRRLNSIEDKLDAALDRR
jgi:hypothetical protein